MSREAATPIVRPFRASDQAAARELIEQGLGERFGFVDRDANPDLRDIAAAYAAPHAAFFVAELDGTLVGTTGLLVEGQAARMVRVGVARSTSTYAVRSAILDVADLVVREEFDAGRAGLR